MVTSDKEQPFFQQLLIETDLAFQLSPICELQKKVNEEWFYSLCGTPLQKNKGILLGINWGVGPEKTHTPQAAIPNGSDITSYNFIKKCRSQLESTLSLDFKEPNFNYTNLCFFRSRTANQLTHKDYELSLPLFKKFVQYINPPWIFSLSSGNTKILTDMGQLKDYHSFYDTENKFKGDIAKLWNINYFSVPHPGAHISGNHRNEIWEKISEEFKTATNK